MLWSMPPANWRVKCAAGRQMQRCHAAPQLASAGFARTHQLHPSYCSFSFYVHFLKNTDHIKSVYYFKFIIIIIFIIINGSNSRSSISLISIADFDVCGFLYCIFNLISSNNRSCNCISQNAIGCQMEIFLYV
jgi:hypothetical protein